jgi:hypothetical protein
MTVQLMLDPHQHDQEEYALFVPTAQPANPPTIHAVIQRHRLPQMQVFGFELTPDRAALRLPARRPMRRFASRHLR